MATNKKNKQTNESHGQATMITQQPVQPATPQPVECLGLTFANDEARREHFLKILAEKLKDPEFRKTPGFPKGEDKDILRLSDPPYYTACPNPFLRDFICFYQNKKTNLDEKIQAFALELPEKRHNPINLAHSYHTKISHETISSLVSHYSKPGDIVLDCFSGSGMTGVGVSLSNSKNSKNEPLRTCVEIDLSPVATRIENSYVTNFPEDEFILSANSLLKELETELGEMFNYEVDNRKIPLSSLVWSEVYICDSCSGELVAWDKNKNIQATKITCSHCNSHNLIEKLERKKENYFDPVLNLARVRVYRKPVLIKLRNNGSSRNITYSPDKLKLPDLAQTYGKVKLHTNKIPYMHMTHERNNLPSIGIEYVHDFFSIRNYACISFLMEKISHCSGKLSGILWFWLNSTVQKMSNLMCYNADGIGRIMKGVYYVPRVGLEVSPFQYLQTSIRDISSFLRYENKNHARNIISTSSSTQIDLPDHSVDYIFTDPPFGDFQLYSDLNFIWESLLGLFTNRDEEVIIDSVQNKNLESYRKLISSALKECSRILKPGKWITIKFHNSSSAVWNTIQHSINDADLIVADISISDKKLGTTKQISDPSTVRQDLIISAYKSTVETNLEPLNNSAKYVFEFIKEHLLRVSIPYIKNGVLELIIERQLHRLFDRMIAFCIKNAIPVTLSLSEFRSSLYSKFIERDGMFFLAEQIPFYDKIRIGVSKVKQIELFVTNESSAIQWIYQQLSLKPQKTHELQPPFMELSQMWSKYETPIDLIKILNDNFICFDGKGTLPEQIYQFFIKNDDNFKSSKKTDPIFISKATNLWYVPDLNKQADLDKIREKSLLKEFESYKASKTKINQFRIEVLRVGFKSCYDTKDHSSILDVTSKIPSEVIDSDNNLSMYYDFAYTLSIEQ